MYLSAGESHKEIADSQRSKTSLKVSQEAGPYSILSRATILPELRSQDLSNPEHGGEWTLSSTGSTDTYAIKALEDGGIRPFQDRKTAGLLR